MKLDYGCIYKVINIQNKKIYIGQTTNFKIRKRRHERNAIKGSHNYFHNALASHGIHNFKWEILGYYNSKQELNEAEIICIEFFQSNNPIYGYNKTNGGTGGDIGLKGKTYEEYYGKEKAKEIRKKSSEGHKGRIKSEEEKQKIRETKKGKKNLKLSKTLKEKGIMKGEKNPMFNHVYTLETKLKMSNSQKNRFAKNKFRSI